MGFFNDVMANTVGVAWSAASGTVDPWTKDGLVEDETNNLVNAGMNPDDALVAAHNDVSSALILGVVGDDGKTLQSADPSAFLAGVKRSITKLGDITNSASKDLLYIGIAVGIGLIAYIIIATPAGKRLVK